MPLVIWPRRTVMVVSTMKYRFTAPPPTPPVRHYTYSSCDTTRSICMPGPVPARRRFRVRDRRKARQSVYQKKSTPRCRRTAPERSHTHASCPPAQRRSIGSHVLPLRCMLHFCTLQSAHGPSFKLVLLVFGPIPMPFCPSPSPSGSPSSLSAAFCSHTPEVLDA